MEGFKLSYSSATLLKGCEQRFLYYKTDTPKDSDFSESVDALNVGTSFHYILEKTQHKKPEKISHLLEHCVKEFKLNEEDVPLVHAMVLKYLRLHKESKLECVGCEIEIQNEYLLGYVDAVMRDERGFWWIVDLKTTARFSPSKIPQLKMDTQLNLYAYFADQIADKLNLRLDKFLGCRYRVTTKSVAKQRKTESYIDFVTRLIDLVTTYDISIPIEKMSPEKINSQHLNDYVRGKMILDKIILPQRNYNYCENYFKPCPYFSNCHGSNFTQNHDGLEVKKL